MADDPGDLANLHDIVLPSPIPYWPPAPGVWILAAGGAGIAAIIIWRAAARYRANAYRRASAAELDGIEASLERGSFAAADAVTAILVLLKRTALAAFPRDAVASLSGPAWSAFLTETVGQSFDRVLIDRLLSQAYDGMRAPGLSDARALVAQARIWVRSHRAADVPGGG
jgi:hypothetical protein